MRSAPDGHRQLGLLTSSVDPVLVDSVTQAGMDFLWLDAEYTGLTPNQVGDVVRRLANSGTRTMVRVPNLDPGTLLTFANTGVDELVLPRVRTLEDIEQARAWLTYPPAGIRPRQVVPATDWGTSYDRQPDVSIIVETMEAVRCLDRIAQAGCVATYWLGPKDLSDDHEHEGGARGAFDDVLNALLDTLRDADLQFGWGVPDPSDVASVWQAGASRCALYWDVHLARHLTRSTGTGIVRSPAPVAGVDPVTR
ncbi:hypothetical protein KVF89_02175 [Nocardioides carbamazepini]|uniref:aldolase/citrate lyase family protein n=1 Tax=Nocardioides carbamazepini TaxID=2854259 RepID=UPI00214A8B07|nr:aldolase/citrate lyase family protein [Nocardioides carbamazepini]MCR1781328.1 hypothetical protein [Nocardioides carbamazepini]